MSRSNLIRHLSNFLRALWFYFPGILFIVLGGLAVGGLTQGQDVLTIAGEKPNAPLLLLVAVIFWALVTWYSGRVVTYAKLQQSPDFPRSYRNLPRFLGFACFVAIGLAALLNPIHPWYFNASLEHPAVYWFILWGGMAIFAFVYYRIQRSELRFFDGWPAWSTWAGTLVFFVLALALRWLPSTGARLVGIGILLLLCGVGFLIVIKQRRKRMDLDGKEAASSLATRTFVLSGIVRGSGEGEVPLESEVRMFWVFNVFAILGGLIYTLAVFFGLWSRNIGSYTFVFLAFGVLLGLGNLVSVFSIRTKVNWHIIMLIVGVILGKVFDPYGVRLEDPEKGDPLPAYEQRQHIEEYIENWVTSREDSIKRYGKYPVFLVLSDGGASRSAYWVGLVLGELQDRYPHFDDHTLLLSSASGGSVGNASYFALLHHLHDRDVQGQFSYRSHLTRFLGKDFLTPTLTRMLGPDPMRHIFPFQLMDDRAAALEVAMEHPYGRTDSGAVAEVFGQPFAQHITHQGEPYPLPLFYVNTTRSQDGRPGVISNVDIDPTLFNLRLDVLDSIDTQHLNKNINLSTVAVLSSRFPYVSPAGAIGDDYFVDGGYFDNSGSGAAHETVLHLKRMAKKLDTTYQELSGQLEFYVIHLTNSSHANKAPKALHPVVNDLAAPLITLAGSYSRQTRVNNSRLRTWLADCYGNDDHWIPISLYRDDGTLEPEYSMNWVISDTTRTRMEKRLDHDEVKEKFARIDELLRQ